jgi:hypothetical protein
VYAYSYSTSASTPSRVLFLGDGFLSQPGPRPSSRSSRGFRSRERSERRGPAGLYCPNDAGFALFRRESLTNGRDAQTAGSISGMRTCGVHSMC